MFEILTANLDYSRRVEERVENGRRYLVASAVILKEGILPGNHGPLFYPGEEIARYPGAWNQIPLTNGHPKKDGQFVLFNESDAGDLGFLRDDRVDGKRRRVKAWFDIEKTNASDPRIIPAVRAGQRIGLSTGLRTRNHAAPPGSTWNGQLYIGIARDYKPDHLAILYDVPGACSLKDGCGINVNELIHNRNPKGCNQFTGPGCALGIAGSGTREDPFQVGSDIKAAARLLSNGHHVRLKQPEQVSTLVGEITRIVKDAHSRDHDAPDFDLCKVSVKGTNLFCQDNLGIPRIKMPQMRGMPEAGTLADSKPRNKKGKVDVGEDFIADLKASGIKVTTTEIRASHLRASQEQIVGERVSELVRKAEAGEDLRKRPIFVTKDNYVLDGHHHWAAIVAHGAGKSKDLKVPVHVVDMEIGEAIDRANSFAKRAGIKPKAGSTANRRLRMFEQRNYFQNLNAFLTAIPPDLLTFNAPAPVEEEEDVEEQEEECEKCKEMGKKKGEPCECHEEEESDEDEEDATANEETVVEEEEWTYDPETGIVNVNPKGCNQFTGPGCSTGAGAGKKAEPVTKSDVKAGSDIHDTGGRIEKVKSVSKGYAYLASGSTLPLSFLRKVGGKVYTEFEAERQVGGATANELSYDPDTGEITDNANPKGCNQFTGPGCGTGVGGPPPPIGSTAAMKAKGGIDNPNIAIDGVRAFGMDRQLSPKQVTAYEEAKQATGGAKPHSVDFLDGKVFFAYSKLAPDQGKALRKLAKKKGYLVDTLGGGERKITTLHVTNELTNNSFEFPLSYDPSRFPVEATMFKLSDQTKIQIKNELTANANTSIGVAWKTLNLDQLSDDALVAYHKMLKTQSQEIGTVHPDGSRTTYNQKTGAFEFVPAPAPSPAQQAAHQAAGTSDRLTANCGPHGPADARSTDQGQANAIPAHIAANLGQGGKPQSMADYLEKNGSPEEKAAWNAVMNAHKEQKDAILTQILQHVQGDQERIAAYNIYKDFSIPQLQVVLSTIPKPQPTANQGAGFFGLMPFNPGGQTGTPGASAPSNVKPLRAPVYNYAKNPTGKN